jgi:hypothetical protein
LESLRRNTHAKRHAIPGRTAAPAAAAGVGASRSGDDAATGWSVKGTKAAKKEAQRRKRRTQHKGGGAAGAAHGRAAAADEASDEEASSSREREEGEEGSSEDERALREEMEALTTEGRLASISEPSAVSAKEGRADGAAAAAAGGGWQRRGRSARRVVVGLVGEPNVGKSSTLNALLGSHRVAVSSHPGRTKHYQTHYVCDRLVLCDCPGLVFPRLDVSLPMQVGRRAA